MRLLGQVRSIRRRSWRTPTWRASPAATQPVRSRHALSLSRFDIHPAWRRSFFNVKKSSLSQKQQTDGLRTIPLKQRRCCWQALRKRMRATPSALPKRIASAVRKIVWCSTSFLVLVETSIAPHAFLGFAREATMRLDIQTPVRCSCEMPYIAICIDILDCMPPMLIAKDSTARI